MPSLISHLTRTQQRELLHDLNYLNIAEIKSFCKKHSLPYAIACQTKDGRRKKTSETDRKGVLLRRIEHFLQTSSSLKQTCFPPSVVCFDPLPQNISPTNKLFYGQYDKKNLTLLTLLKELTNGQFQDGAIARILLRDFWSRGNVPTIEEFASAWLYARASHTKPNPEWAFLSDRSAKLPTSNWKKLRLNKAKKAISILNRIKPNKFL
jgi:hypothetical protein